MRHQSDVKLRPGGPEKTLTPVIFSTEKVEKRHRLDLWRSTYERFNRIQVLDEPGNTDGFWGRNEVWSLGGIAVMRNAGPAVLLERSSLHIRADSADHWVIRFLLAGRSRFRSGDISFELRPFVPFVFSLGEPFVCDRTRADWVSLYIPRDDFPDLSASLGQLGPRLIDTASARLLADYIVALEHRLPMMSYAQVPSLARATCSMVAACLLTETASGAVTSQDRTTAQFERVRAMIRANIASPSFGPRRLSALSGISRSQLYRLFERHGGIARYIQDTRLRMVQSALADPLSTRVPIAVIAERMGFYDASAFGRVFRREFGCTPRQARMAALAGLGPDRAGDHPRSAEPGADNFSAVLRGLSASSAR